MSERYWPKDAIGNEVKKNALVAAQFPQGVPVICRVQDVIEAGFTSDEADKRMEMQGAVTLVIQIPYQPNQTTVPQLLRVMEPEESRIHRPQ